jgi:dynein heavy chain
LYKNVNVYRTQKGNLDIIVDIYNEILRTLLNVEKPLLNDRIQRINKALQPGIDSLRWNSAGIDPFIKYAMEVVTEVDELVRLMKDNVRKMQQMMIKWKDSLFDRRMKPFPPDELEQNHQSLVGPKLEDIKIHGKEIHRLLKVTQENIKPDKKSKSWLSYVDYVNGLVIEGITEGISGSMKYLADQINIKYNAIHGNPPIFEIRVDLEDLESGKRTVVFDPTIQSNPKDNGIRDILQKIIDDFISIAIQIPGRIDTGSGDYLVEIKDQFQLYGDMQVIQNNFHEIELATESFIDQYKEMDFLWKETLAESFEAFLNTGEDPREARHVFLNDDGEEIEDDTFGAMADIVLVGVSTKRPSLEHFDEKITFLNSIKNDIASMKTVIDIGWLRVHATPLIKELQNTVTQWIDCYTSFLMDNTIAEIKNIQNFIDDVAVGIKVIPESAESKKEKELLMKVMEHIRDVKMIRDRTFNEIEPMKQTVMLLKKHQFKMDEDFLVKLENSKTALVDVSEKAMGPVKEQILPLQNQEAGNIKQRLSKFNVQVQEFRIDFQNNCPYHIDKSSPEIIDTSYGCIGEYFEKTTSLEDEAKTLNNLETLFDMQKSSYKANKDCRNDLQNLKQMWDLISLIDFQFETWKSTLWDKIDTDNLMSQIKEMQTKQCNPQSAQNKEIKNFKAFFALNDRVKNMNTILPLISQLHSKFMQERHWKKLMRITGQKIDFQSPNFCLEDLIKLQLYRYSEEVTELVDGAQKEAKIEAKLNVIQSTWEDQKFDFKEYHEVPILGDLGDIIEFVEQH